MPGGIDLSVVLAYTVGLIVLYLLFRLMWVPAKLLMRALYAVCAGTLAILVFNVFGRYFSLYIPVNPLSVLSAGFLGLPGICLILALKSLF
ncbi:MAG: pro-sigmaK processing inhibitor BofA family protein [Bacillota bacterium]|nr:pro-sigmaK processing inhibitor BofA family protein [Bacillota bacterium]